MKKKYDTKGNRLIPYNTMFKSLKRKQYKDRNGHYHFAKED